MEQSKDIADIERQLAALSGDNSASARAKRAQLEAELAEANAALEETYYERSISNQQEALDKELENFQKTKEDEMEGWDEYLENTNKVVADSLSTVQANTDVVYQTLKEMGQEYSLSITDALTSPWKAGESAIQSYSDKFGITTSETIKKLQELEAEFAAAQLEIEKAGGNAVTNVKENSSAYTEANYKEPAKPETPAEKPKEEAKKAPPSAGDKVTVKKSATHWGSRSGGKKMASWVPGSSFTVGKVYSDGQIGIGKKDKKGKFAYTGVIKLTDLEGYAKGTTGVKNDQLALIDELGEELVMHADGNGRLAFLSKGTSVLNSTLTDRIMDLAMDPQDMLERNKPTIGIPSEIHNTEIHIDNSIAELIHIDNCSTETLPDVKKIVNEALEKHTKQLNQSLKRFTR